MTRILISVSAICSEWQKKKNSQGINSIHFFRTATAVSRVTNAAIETVTIFQYGASIKKKNLQENLTP